MKNLKQFAKVVFFAIVALLLISTLMAAYGAADSAIAGNRLFSPLSSAHLFFNFTAFIGLWSIIFWGAPAYYILSVKGLAFWPQVMLVGLIPGIIACFIEIEFGIVSIVCGVSVAALTHIFCRKWVLTTQSRGTSV